jgi:hypothetical protein
MRPQHDSMDVMTDNPWRAPIASRCGAGAKLSFKLRLLGDQIRTCVAAGLSAVDVLNSAAASQGHGFPRS